MSGTMLGPGDHEINNPDTVLPTQNLHSSREDKSGKINYLVNDLVPFLLLLMRSMYRSLGSQERFPGRSKAV